MTKKLLLLIAVFTFSLESFAQWSAIGNGLNGDVNATCVYNNEIYATGNFTNNGSSTSSLSHVAMWNGTNWVAVGTGVDGNIASIVVYNSELYVGGDFLNAGGSPASRIAKWNGSSWSAVGSGFNNSVRCLYVWNNELYAGGTFVLSGSTSIGRIGKLSGSNWVSFGGGAVGPVNAIMDYNNELYIGGNWFPPYVSKFNSTTLSFDDLTGSGGPDNEVTCLAVFKKQTSSNVVLWIGGKFNTPSPRLCTWTSAGGFATSFNNFNATAGANVTTLLATSNYLFAGGGFTVTVSSNTISRLARYNGSSYWDSLSAVPDNDVNAFAVYNGYLVTGGKFTSLGTPGAANRMAWRNLFLNTHDLNGDVVALDFFPNPMIQASVLKLQTKSNLRQPELKIFNMQGRIANPFTETIPSHSSGKEAEFRIDRSGLPAGIYFFLIDDDQTHVASGKFVVE